MRPRRLTHVAIGLFAFFVAGWLPSAASANPWHRAHYYGVTNDSPDDVWADLRDAYDSAWGRHDYDHWFGYGRPVYLQGCPGRCGFTPLNYRGHAPNVLTGSHDYPGASWYRLPGSELPSPAN